MATAIYARVSSNSQDTKSQEKDLKALAATREGEIIWFKESATGTSFDRPVWKKLEEAINSRKISEVIVWRLDRLGRTTGETIVLLDHLDLLKIRFTSIKEGFDSSTSAGRLMRNVLASFAAYETEVRRERQTAGIAAALESGKRWGGKKAGTISKKIAAKEPTVLMMKDQGNNVSEIARVLEIPRKTVYEIIKRRKELVTV